MFTEIETFSSSLRQPSAEQLFHLSALPSGMLGASSSASSSRTRGKKKSRPKLAREGQIVSRLFDNRSTRPNPTNGLSLEQSITLEMSVATPGFIASSATTGLYTYASFQAAISAYAGASSLLAVFDQYRIEQVECWIEISAPNNTGSLPELYSCVDLDDANGPTSVGQVQDHLGAIVSGGLAGHYHKWRPHVAVAVYSGAFTSFSNAESCWIDSASPNVQHYGLKAATLSTGALFSFNIVSRVVVSFRAPAIN
jgi:hypothetical protein